jgi:hypothetical protein
VELTSLHFSQHSSALFSGKFFPYFLQISCRSHEKRRERVSDELLYSSTEKGHELTQLRIQSSSFSCSSTTSLPFPFPLAAASVVAGVEFDFLPPLAFPFVFFTELDASVP